MDCAASLQCPAVSSLFKTENCNNLGNPKIMMHCQTLITVHPQRLRRRRILKAFNSTHSVVQNVRMEETTTSASSGLKFTSFPIMVNSVSGRMGKAVAEAAVSAGLKLLPLSFSEAEKSGELVSVSGLDIQLSGSSNKEKVLSSLYQEHPDLVVVDYTVPDAVNENAELYSKVGVPFVMGTTGGDRKKLMDVVIDSNVYAVIAPQMGKQVVAFQAAMEILAEQFPGAFTGYSLQALFVLQLVLTRLAKSALVNQVSGTPMNKPSEVMESHQAGKLDVSRTAKAIISCFEKLGVSFTMDQVQKIRDPIQQKEMVGVPEEHLAGHAFHMYHLTSPDQTVSFEFQHNVCGRSIYAQGTIDAAIFLRKKIKEKSEKRLYNMIDVLREGNMR